MSERVPSPFEKTNPVPNAVTVFTGKTIFEGWEDLQLTRELNSAASDFQFQMTDKWEQNQESFRLQPGDPIHIHVAKQAFLTGWVDKVSVSVSAGKRGFTISGRSKTADLVDCSADGSQFSGLDLKTLAEKLITPFGLKVVFKTEPGAIFDTLTVEPGQTIFQLLDKCARQRKILMYPSYDGNLVFSAQAEKRSSTALVQGVNIISGKANFDNTNRFSKYTTKGQNLAFLGDAAQSVAVQGAATDEGITRYRPLVLMAEHSLDDQKSEDRASYEAHLRAAKSLEVEIMVQGWFQQDGTPWEINQLVRVDSGFLGVRRQMLIKKVTFNKSNAGTTTNIELTRNDAFLFGTKAIKKEDPLGWTKFVK